MSVLGWMKNYLNKRYISDRKAIEPYHLPICIVLKLIAQMSRDKLKKKQNKPISQLPKCRSSSSPMLTLKSTQYRREKVFFYKNHDFIFIKKISTVNRSQSSNKSRSLHKTRKRWRRRQRRRRRLWRWVRTSRNAAAVYCVVVVTIALKKPPAISVRAEHLRVDLPRIPPTTIWAVLALGGT